MLFGFIFEYIHIKNLIPKNIDLLPLTLSFYICEVYNIITHNVFTEN